MKTYTKAILILLIFFSIISCSTIYYKKVNNNIEDFYAIINHIEVNKLIKKSDSILKVGSPYLNNHSIPITLELDSASLKPFLEKYDLSSIWVIKDSKLSEDSLIRFIKNAPPYFSSPTIFYDKGKSNLRQSIEKGERIFNNKNGKIIDSNFIYIER